jgi:VIT1/CCC1 family predicted Fe2+/Mn2+ transporter
MNRSFPPARYRVKPESAFLEDLIDPIDRLTESLFSILILLTFTMTSWIISRSGSSEHTLTSENLFDLAIAALFTVIAYGVIDGVIYALLTMFGRGESHRLLQGIQAADSDQEAVGVIADNLDYMLEPITGDQERRLLYSHILDHLRNSQPREIGLKREDITAGLTHILVAILVIIPPLFPLVAMRQDPGRAILASNLISFFLLFFVGYRWGKYTGTNPWKTGLIILSVIIVLVLFLFWLGG